MNALQFLLPPLVGGLIGWVTNALAVKMLFHPQQPWRLGPLTIQGVFPKRKAALAERLGAVIEAELLGPGEIGAMLRDPAMARVVHETLEDYVEKLIGESLPRAVPMVAVFLSPDMVARLKGMLVPELEKMLPELMDKASANIEARLDIKEHIRAKVESFSMDRLEDMLQAIMQKEFRFIEVSGGILGALIGLAQAGLNLLL